ncbi:MAG: hypothetical protein Q7S19_01225 [bacterium]|nr:hypothetical protein [bacterium]
MKTLLFSGIFLFCLCATGGLAQETPPAVKEFLDLYKGQKLKGDSPCVRWAEKFVQICRRYPNCDDLEYLRLHDPDARPLPARVHRVTFLYYKGTIWCQNNSIIKPFSSQAEAMQWLCRKYNYSVFRRWEPEP